MPDAQGGGSVLRILHILCSRIFFGSERNFGGSFRDLWDFSPPLRFCRKSLKRWPRWYHVLNTPVEKYVYIYV